MYARRFSRHPIRSSHAFGFLTHPSASRSSKNASSTFPSHSRSSSDLDSA